MNGQSKVVQGRNDVETYALRNACFLNNEMKLIIYHRETSETETVLRKSG